MPTSLLDPEFQKPVPAEVPIHELLRQRWSPRAFSKDALTVDELTQLFQAARWSPSAFNEQPWSFMVASRSQPKVFDQLLHCLNPGNQAWAKEAALLAIGIARRDLSSKPQANRHAHYDLGQAVAHLTFQATSLGIAVHQMAGFDVDKARSEYAIPEGHDPVVAIAIGRPGDSSALPEPARQKDAAPRARKLLSEFVFSGAWTNSGL